MASHSAISKRRAARRIRDDRAGCPIEAARYRMYRKAGPAKIRLDVRVVPKGPLSHEPNAVPLTGSLAGALSFQIRQ